MAILGGIESGISDKVYSQGPSRQLDIPLRAVSSPISVNIQSIS